MLWGEQVAPGDLHLNEPGTTVVSPTSLSRDRKECIDQQGTRTDRSLPHPDLVRRLECISAQVDRSETDSSRSSNSDRSRDWSPGWGRLTNSRRRGVPL